MIRADIDRGVGYVIEDQDGPAGAFAFIPGIDPTYGYIEGGAWLDDALPYATIHRLSSLHRAHGIAQLCFEWCWERIPNLRIDTHSDNLIMRHCIQKAGFRYCGVIYLLSGAPRLAFQKL